MIKSLCSVSREKYLSAIMMTIQMSIKLSITLISSSISDTSSSDDNVLVLEVPMGTSKVILGKKRYGDR